MIHANVASYYTVQILVGKNFDEFAKTDVIPQYFTQLALQYKLFG